MAYIIIPPILWKVNNILPYLYKFSDEINRFCSKNGWFLMILAKFYQKFLPKYKILVSQAQRTVFFFFFYPSPALNLHLKVFTKLHDFSCKNTKFSSFWGGTSLSDTPPVSASAQLTLTCHKSSPPCQRQIYAPAYFIVPPHWVGVLLSYLSCIFMLWVSLCINIFMWFVSLSIAIIISYLVVLYDV